MIIESVLAGLLGGMNILADKWTDVRFHINDGYMIALMVGWMVFFEILFGKLSKSHTHLDFPSFLNNIIIISLFVAIMIYLLRQQIFVSDRQYITGMIPHHSMAVLMSKRILDKTRDPAIIKFANDIITNQEQELEILNDLEKKYI
jgi:hypothetical protein